MICIKAEIPEELSLIDDELKQFTIAQIQYVFSFSKHEKREANLWRKQKECRRLKEKKCTKNIANSFLNIPFSWW